ncbi:MAG: His/Gly/Thr/Pro-type tRNA ligase C-terminal domain-containing protein, partial [Henriciella sp.]
EKINYKVREHSVQKVPVIAVVGAREAESGAVALRRFGSKAQSVVSLEDAIRDLSAEALAPDLRRAEPA